MSSGLCHPTGLSLRPTDSLKQNMIHYGPHAKPSKFNQNIFYPNKAGTVIVRRPFKYLKHQGPRPAGANLGLMFMIQVGNGSRSEDSTAKECGLMKAAGGETRQTKSEDGCGRVEGLQAAGSESRGETRGEGGVVQKNEGGYGPPFSRLLRSRKLNLTALDLSACRKRQSASQMAAAREGQAQPSTCTAEPASQGPGTARPSAAWLRTSHFSDWSNSAPTTSCPSAALCDTPTVIGLPNTPALNRDLILPKKRISSVSRLPLSFNNHHPNPFANSRSRSDFGLNSYS